MSREEQIKGIADQHFAAMNEAVDAFRELLDISEGDVRGMRGGLTRFTDHLYDATDILVAWAARLLEADSEGDQ